MRSEYTLKDHLGNSRVTFADIDGDGTIDETTEILQENHYYPFGMGMEGLQTPQVGSENKYGYNGKEMNDDSGLGWMDYGARWYDASIARWSAVDPLAEEMNTWSPYNYVFNNPIRLIDPDGESPESPQDDYYRNAAGDIVMIVRNDSNNDRFYTISNNPDGNGSVVTLDNTRDRNANNGAWTRLRDSEKNYVVNAVDREMNNNLNPGRDNTLNNEGVTKIQQEIATNSTSAASTIAGGATITGGTVATPLESYGTINGGVKTVTQGSPIDPGRTTAATEPLSPVGNATPPTPAAGTTEPLPNGILPPNQTKVISGPKTIELTDDRGNNHLGNLNQRGQGDYERKWDK